MRILIVSEMFPPVPAVGSMRIGRLARALADRGHEVHVVTQRYAGRATAASGGPPAGVTVHEIDPWVGPLLRLRRLVGRVMRQARASGLVASAEPEGTSGGTARAPGARERWRRLVRLLDNLPDEASGLIPAAVLQSRRLRDRPFDLVYATGPAFSSLLAGTMVARTLGAPLALEFRDPWVGNAYAPGRDLDALERRAAVRMERWCLERAAMVVTVTESAGAIYRDRVRALGRPVPVHAVMNGIERVDAARHPAPGDGVVRILYAGELYARRNLNPVLRAMGRLRDDPTLPRLELAVVGRAAEHVRVFIAQAAAQAGVADRLHVRDWVPTEEVARLQREADILLLLAESLTVQVPNKLFDYLGTRAPILAIAEPDGEVTRLLQAVGGHVSVAPRDEEALTEALRQMARAAVHRPCVGDASVLGALGTGRAMPQLCETVEGAFTPAPAPTRR